VRRHDAGFTLVEVVMALTIVATLLVITFAGLRVGLAAWQRGDERAQSLERARSVVQIITKTLGAAYPYQAAAMGREPARLLFEGAPDRVAFVTAAPPFPGPDPVAFTAVSLGMSGSSASGLALTQKVLPNDKPFDPSLVPTLVDASVAGLRFRYLKDTKGDYLKDTKGEWSDRWDATEEKALPLAIEVTLTILHAGRPAEQPPLLVSIPVTAP
jgi:prepilin-type N-terminal cleavage/methylation domain-containing protein